MNEKVVYKTKSLCPTCLKIIPATIFEKDGKVWIKKRCTKHGMVQDLYWGSSKLYRKAGGFAYEGRGTGAPNVKKDNPLCPKDCGLCSLHKSHTALANLVVTNRCDLNCWYCFFFAQKAGYVYEPSIDELRSAITLLKKESPIPGNAVQITGGEPSLRDDIVDIIKMIKNEGIHHVQYNTNGIRLSQDVGLAHAIKKSGISTLYLSFDGVTPRTNPKNHFEIPGMLKNSREANLGMVLVPTVIKSVNDHEVGDIVRFGFKNIDVVRGVNFQPVSLVGRMPRKERERHRITIPDVIKRIEEQTNGEIAESDFYPVPSVKAVTRFVEALTGEPQYSFSTHFACGMATYVFSDGDKILPITRFIDVEGLFKYIEEKAAEINSGENKLMVGAKMMLKLNSFIDSAIAPKGIPFDKMIYNAIVKHDYRSLATFHNRALFIGMMHFMDLYNYDIERVKRCSVHYLMPDAILPFCTFNVIPEWYRDKVQNKYGVSFKEWEEKSGKKFADDAYKRDVEKLRNTEEYKKTYGDFVKTA